ncbi:hypothetical protein [Fundidesulfovibrio soli]|uniref:hypothetical protein n=1 Tax=Fundidesulfovibrio soli TaxID=2922716 RepID=UPI001FAF39BC|nr:hypothetical protein [Fundidesulfovibrio soli]
MHNFRMLLAIFTACILMYTGVVVSTHGWNLFPVFFGELAALTWSGQFNLDFTCFLILSGIWTAWRHGFSRWGIVLGVAGFFGGMLFLAPYLVFASYKEQGDMAGVLLGVNRPVG